MSEEQKLIAEMGKPRLGERHVIRVRIRESKEFKVLKIHSKKTKEISMFIVRMRLIKLYIKLIQLY